MSPHTFRASQPRSTGFSGRRILLLDDDANGRRDMAEYLQFRGAFIFQAGRGSDALILVRQQLVQAQPIHLLMLDYHLERETGVDVLRSLRPLVPQVPAVLASHCPPEDIARHPDQFGFLSVVVKGGKVI